LRVISVSKDGYLDKQGLIQKTREKSRRHQNLKSCRPKTTIRVFMFQVPKSFKFFSLVFASTSKIKAGADKEIYACGQQQ